MVLSWRGASAAKSSKRCVGCFAMLAMTLALTSCLTPTGQQTPAEVVSYGVQGGAGTTGMHTVLQGDTVYTVSQNYNLPLREIISLNNLVAPYYLQQGYRIKLPPPNEYKVKQGDTLNGLSRLFDASVSEMAKINNLSAPYILKNGQVLRLPAPQPKLEEEFASNVAPPSFDSAPMKVASVESEILPPPPLAGNETVQVVPAVSTSGYPPQPNAVPAQQAQVQKVAVVQPSIAPKIPARTGNGKFMRPVDGKVISGYGPKADGLHNDGINIKAPRGTAVRAAENGVIAYTGSEMAGYGNLVLVRHGDRYMTAYAHMDKILVKKGDTVKAGQSIGTVGSTGGVDSPQLHFEVRKGTNPVNPDTYL